MNIRENNEKWEEGNLSSFAKLSSKSKGRKKKEAACDIRTEFQKDRDKILHSLSFRLLKHKTQVFLSTTGEEFRTRLTHTLEVTSVARYIASALKLNQYLVEAISLGHDLGHTPFGHIGEDVLNEITPFEFRHNEQSVRVVEKLENDGKGLNLTEEVIHGILTHSKGTSSIFDIHAENINRSERRNGCCRPATMEGEVVQIADWIAYINHDIDDAFNMDLINEKELPSGIGEVLGYNFEQRFVAMIKNVIESSYEKEHIQMSSIVMEKTDELRAFLYEYVYRLPQISIREETARAIMLTLYNYYLKNYSEVIKEMPYLKDETKERGVCDFIASLTDLRAQELYRKLRRKSSLSLEEN